MAPGTSRDVSLRVASDRRGPRRISCNRSTRGETQLSLPRRAWPAFEPGATGARGATGTAFWLTLGAFCVLGSNRFLRRWLGPDRDAPGPTMRQHARAEVVLVFPLDLGHSQKTVDQILASAANGMARGSLVFNDISTLEPARAVHRSEPATEVTHQPEHPAHQRCSYLAHLVWTAAQALKHLSNQFAVMPLFLFDGPDASAFVRVAH